MLRLRGARGAIWAHGKKRPEGEKSATTQRKFVSLLVVALPCDFLHLLVVFTMCPKLRLAAVQLTSDRPKTVWRGRRCATQQNQRAPQIACRLWQHSASLCGAQVLSRQPRRQRRPLRHQTTDRPRGVAERVDVLRMRRTAALPRAVLRGLRPAHPAARHRSLLVREFRPKPCLSINL